MHIWQVMSNNGMQHHSTHAHILNDVYALTRWHRRKQKEEPSANACMRRAKDVGQWQVALPKASIYLTWHVYITKTTLAIVMHHQPRPSHIIHVICASVGRPFHLPISDSVSQVRCALGNRCLPTKGSASHSMCISIGRHRRLLTASRIS